MHGIETSLDNLFKKAPQLPEGARKGLASALPWLTLIGGILSLIGAWGIFSLVNLANQISTGYGLYGYTAPVATFVGPLVWVGLALIVLQAILFLVAFPGLRAHKKSGWNILLWVSFVNIIYDIVYNIFAYMNIGQLIFSLIGAVIGLYLLFQVRSYFTAAGAPPTPKAPTTPASPSTPAAPTSSTPPTTPKV